MKSLLLHFKYTYINKKITGIENVLDLGLLQQAEEHQERVVTGEKDLDLKVLQVQVPVP